MKTHILALLLATFFIISPAKSMFPAPSKSTDESPTKAGLTQPRRQLQKAAHSTRKRSTTPHPTSFSESGFRHKKYTQLTLSDIMTEPS